MAVRVGGAAVFLVFLSAVCFSVEAQPNLLPPEPTVIVPGARPYINAFPFQTPYADDCLLRSLELLNGCETILQAANSAGNDTVLSIIYTCDTILMNVTADKACYNASAHFLNGGCLCDNLLISTISSLNSVPQLAKDALSALNQLGCPQPAAPAPAPSYEAVSLLPRPDEAGDKAPLAALPLAGLASVASKVPGAAALLAALATLGGALQAAPAIQAGAAEAAGGAAGGLTSLVGTLASQAAASAAAANTTAASEAAAILSGLNSLLAGTDTAGTASLNAAVGDLNTLMGAAATGSALSLASVQAAMANLLSLIANESGTLLNPSNGAAAAQATLARLGTAVANSSPADNPGYSGLSTPGLVAPGTNTAQNAAAVVGTALAYDIAGLRALLPSNLAQTTLGSLGTSVPSAAAGVTGALQNAQSALPTALASGLPAASTVQGVVQSSQQGAASGLASMAAGLPNASALQSAAQSLGASMGLPSAQTVAQEAAVFLPAPGVLNNPATSSLGRRRLHA